jgi:hypothetical protein
VFQPPDPFSYDDSGRNPRSYLEEERDFPQLIESDDPVSFFKIFAPGIRRVHLQEHGSIFLPQVVALSKRRIEGIDAGTGH